ncbi:glycosyltransferase family 4 protein [Fervidibacter sacchari]|uniref:Glycosyltransferase involved in cell wall biosynthesis n=1 Tax=Candidatus Fervidibacter sacchari TaxID=1448929 RepID=A0ABT2EKR9_9BACT|nr:glycosyltransferase family 4 protein [Candidatus Fervidibacter sacchari]MCS3918542.1 glycosyltransferase involved in cell wall biosynthesis [Candidatus Fervidibacter sacchari]WKU17696.1 glycosyltransferase family 4 protein [Candidatus Fervidibacter sacchari]
MNLLVCASHLFPNYKNPNAGSFVVEQLRHLQRYCEITVLVPHPWVPPVVGRLSKKWRQYAQLPDEETVAGIKVLHPRRLVIPKVNSWAWMTVSVTLSYWHFLSRSHRFTDSPFHRFTHIEGHFVLPDGFATAFLGRQFGKPSIIHVHGTDVHTIPQQSALLKFLTVWALRHADAIRAVSSDLAERAIKLMDAETRRSGETEKAKKVWVIPNGVDLNKFRVMARQEARQQLGLDEDKRYLLYVGRLVAVKGLDLLLDAFAQLTQKWRDVELLLVGDGTERGALKHQATALGIRDKVHFVGAQPHERIVLWMNAGDVFCLPSHKEGLPTVLLEALACGTPIVATSVGGIPEIVAEGQVGRLVRSRDPKEMAACIEEVLETRWDRQRLRDYVAERFSFDVVTRKLLEMYGSVMRES